MDWFPWYPALYRADTLDLTLEQDGAYRRLIDHYMETRLPLPDNDNSLARIVGISINDFQAIAEQVRCKFTTNGGELHSKRCDIELNRQDSLSKKRSEVAKAAHRKRNKNNGLEAIAEQGQSNSTNTGQDRTNIKDTNVSLSEKGKTKNGKSRLPEDWRPNPKSYEIGIGEGYTNDEINWTATGFADYWIESGKIRKDWDRTFYNWLRSDITRRSVRERRKGVSGANNKGNTGFAELAVRTLSGNGPSGF